MNLVDTFGRRVSYLRISVTDRCNLRCSYCSPLLLTQSRKDLLTFEEIIRIVRIALKIGITKFRITGGEPLVRKDVQSLIGAIAGLSGVKDLSLTTNGLLLKRYARDLKAAGLMRINISLDTLKEERFQKICGMNGLRQVLEGLDEAERVGLFPIKINTVLIKGFNDDEILDFVNLASLRGWKLRFIELMPFGNADSAQFLSQEEVLAKLGSVFSLNPLPDDGGVAKRFSINRKTEIGIISPLSNSFCDECNRLRLTADGKLRSCLMREYEVDLFQMLRNNCSDLDLIQGFLNAVQMKPKGHELHRAEFRKCARPMNTIGG